MLYRENNYYIGGEIVKGRNGRLQKSIKQNNASMVKCCIRCSLE